VGYQDFDAKLRMTASVLGCANRKELVARFRAANPATQCDLDRLHKWLQGRALPRSSEVLKDWASVLGSGRDGAWLANCALAAFAQELAGLFGRDAEQLLSSEAFAGRGSRTAAPAAAAEPRMSGTRYLCGDYACYSAAWSPYMRGKLIRGGLTIRPGRGPALTATYSEMLIDKPVRFTGVPIIARRTLHMHLNEPGGELPLFFSLFMPRPPAGVLCGVMSGVTLLGQDPEPSASRIAIIRVAADAPLDATNRYLDTDRGTVAADLAALALSPANPSRVDRLVLDFLCGNQPAYQVESAQQAALAAELDPIHLGSRPAGAVERTTSPLNPLRRLARS